MRKITGFFVLAAASLLFGAAEAASQSMTWTNNGAYDGVSVERTGVASSKCDQTAWAEVGTVAGAVAAFTDATAPAGHVCYRVRAWYNNDFGAGPVKVYSVYSNVDSDKPGKPAALLVQ